jgi:hypothetical protein
MTGPSRNGSAKPFATFEGSSTITVTRAEGALPTTALTASAYASIRAAMLFVHSSISEGKWMSNRSVLIVRQGIWGRVRYCAPDVAGDTSNAPAIPKKAPRRATLEQSRLRQYRYLVGLATSRRMIWS